MPSSACGLTGPAEYEWRQRLGTTIVTSHPRRFNSR